MTVLISGCVSFIIASIGWVLVARRANLTAQRSETFSSISPLVSILDDLEDMAESQLHESLDIDSSEDAIAKLLKTRQVFSIKSLAKFDLLRSKLSLLNKSDIFISKGSLIDLKKSLTLSYIDDVSKYKCVLNATHKIHLELQQAFERKYKKNRSESIVQTCMRRFSSNGKQDVLSH